MTKKLTLSTSISEKYQQMKQEENNLQEVSKNEIIDPAISKIASNKDEAMKEFKLKPITIAGKYDLEEEEDLTFTILSKKLTRGIKQELASQYVKEGIKRDAKKHNIPIIK